MATLIEAGNFRRTTKTKRIALGNPDTRQFIYLIFISVLHGSQDVLNSAEGMAHRVVDGCFLCRSLSLLG